MIDPTRRETREAVAVALAAALLAALLTGLGALARWDWLIYDSALRASHRPAPERVVIVAIDDVSLEAAGRWPWSRHRHAELLDALTDAGAVAVGLDVLFAEPSVETGADEALAEAVRRNGRVAMPVLAAPGPTAGTYVELRPLASLAGGAAALGHVELPVEVDGLVRQAHLRAGVAAPRWPSLAAAVLGIAEGGSAAEPPPASGPGPWVHEDPMLIRFLGPPRHFTRVPALEILAGESPAALDGAIALVGVTAAGLGGGLATPVSGGAGPMPAVEVVASEMASLADGSWVRPLPSTLAATIAAALTLLGVLVARPAGRAALVTAGVAVSVGPVLVALAMLAFSQLWWPPLGAAAAGSLGFVSWLGRRLSTSRRAVAEGERRAEATLRSIGDAVITTDLEGRVQYLNPVAQSLTGWSPDEAEGRPWNEVVKLATGAAADPVRTCIENLRSSATIEPVGMVVRDGSEHSVHACASPVQDAEGRASGAVIALRDVTEAARLARELVHQAHHDELTGLPNRTLLLDRLDTAVARAERRGRQIAVLFVDVDRFKLVNDGYGHAFGDRVLVEIAERLRRTCRAQDTVARLGGDEFVIVLEELRGERDAAAAGHKLREAIALPASIEGREIFISGSIGVSIYPKDGGDAGELLKHADAAMYRAKDAGRDTVEFFSEALNARSLRRIDIERRLRQALARDELVLHYQPLVRLGGGGVAGAEALARWNEPELGVIGPAEFITVAEDSGLITSIGEWVLDTACRQAARWDPVGREGLRVSVNVSPRQLLHQDVSRLIETTLASSRLDPGRLELEVTESVMMHETERYERALNAIRDLGVQIAVDDFGTGYSSLSYLKRFPVDRVKIDRSFVHDIGTPGEGTAISRAVIAMARSLDMGVVAEGLESRVQLDFLRERHCDEGQGFFLCPPMAPRELDEWLAEIRARSSPTIDAFGVEWDHID